MGRRIANVRVRAVTCLKPIESRAVRGVASERYPCNKKCAHPECAEPAVDPHHCFPRSQIGNDSWFVEIIDHSPTEAVNTAKAVSVIPHVTGLCRAHHDDVEQHRAWIKLEDGVFAWWDRQHSEFNEEVGSEDAWLELGPLNPQPGSVEGKPKRRKFKGEERRQRKTISLRVPDDASEDGAGLLTDLIDQLEGRIQGGDEAKHRPPYFTLCDALNFAILNANHDDFEGV